MPISPERILLSDPHFLAVNKLSGELVVKGKGRVDTLPLLDFLRLDYPGLRALHRLDFETSGVVVFARTKQAEEAVLKSKFSGWKKVYRALVLGYLAKKSGEINFPLVPRSGEGVVKAETKYKVLEEFRPCSYVETSMERGQFHQIRRHFAAIKHPLVLDDEHGDKKYNRQFALHLKFHRFFLHALSIDFPHPLTGERVHIEAPLPRQFEAVLKKLRKEWPMVGKNPGSAGSILR